MKILPKKPAAPMTMMNFRVDAALKAKIEAKAKRAKMTTSELLRYIVEKALSP